MARTPTRSPFAQAPPGRVRTVPCGSPGGRNCCHPRFTDKGTRLKQHSQQGLRSQGATGKTNTTAHGCPRAKCKSQSDPGPTAGRLACVWDRDSRFRAVFFVAFVWFSRAQPQMPKWTEHQDSGSLEGGWQLRQLWSVAVAPNLLGARHLSSGGHASKASLAGRSPAVGPRLRSAVS